MESASQSTKDNTKGKDGSCNVQVAVRCRPTNEEERKAGVPSVITCDSDAKSVKVSYGPTGKKTIKSFNFDKVFGMYSTQEQVFEQVVSPIVDEVLAGFNCTIFAYGQTGTGKTHTMEGDINCEENAGIVPRSVNEILQQLESSGSEFTIRVSFLELYNEELRDLLSSNSDKQLKLCEDIKKGVVCQNLEEITVLNAKDIFDILHRGIEQRQTAETMMNKNSSRSHSIFTMKIMIKEYQVDGEEVVRHGQLNLVDLAGSECIARSGAKNDRAREAGSINQSLLTLGRVITALVDHHGHIPYRDSKLTRLLQESLGGKAKTCIIATLSPSQLAMEESLSTLDYAHRAKNIKNQPTVNQKMTKKVVLKEYCAEIEHLKVQLQLTREKNGVYVDPNEFYSMESRISSQESQLQECEMALKSKNEEVKTLKSENIELTVVLENTQAQLNEVKENINTITNKYEETKSILEVTKVELTASDAVISEQSITENELLTQGDMLHNELSNRRCDINELLSKIDRFLAMESHRAAHTDKLASSMSSIKRSINDKTNSFKQVSDEQADKLNNGITDMLHKSRTTCESLRESINHALKTLIDDAKLAKNSMTSSCDDLTKHLLETNSNVSETLVSVQSNLSKWLDDVDCRMKDAQKQLSEQKNQLGCMANCINTYASNYHEQSLRLVNLHKSNSTDVSCAVNTIKTEFLAQLEKFEAAQSANSIDAKEVITKQAAELESTITSMLRSLVTKSVETLENSASITNDFSSELKSNQFSGLDNITKLMTKSYSAVDKETSEMSINCSKMKDEQTQIMKNVEQSRFVLETSLSSVSDSVDTQKDIVSNTVSKTIQHMNTSIQDATVAVNNTSRTANKILQDVTTATSNMNDSAVQSMDGFNNFLNTKGDDFKGEISTHFCELSRYLENQTKDNREMENQIEKYTAAVIATKVEITGKTPLKTIFKPLSQLPHTREHEIIKNEIRSNPGLFASNLTENQITINVSSDLLSDEGLETSSILASSTDSNKELISSIRSEKHPDDDNQENIKPEVLNKVPIASKTVNNSMKLKSSLHKDSSIPSLRSTRNNTVN